MVMVALINSSLVYRVSKNVSVTRNQRSRSRLGLEKILEGLGFVSDLKSKVSVSDCNV